jgi:hypothetical protein
MKFWLSLLSDIATELEGEGVNDKILAFIEPIALF